MNLTDLKTKPIPELLEIAHEMGMDNLGRLEDIGLPINEISISNVEIIPD